MALLAIHDLRRVPQVLSAWVELDEFTHQARLHVRVDFSPNDAERLADLRHDIAEEMANLGCTLLVPHAADYWKS